ncbi:MAG: tRNA epoxyqueuosine(34) reductase QueG [Candidatus Baltobacteraceae bacterium]
MTPFRREVMDDSLRSELVRRAHELGAIAVRFTRAGTDEPTHERLAKSFERGDLATWSYDERYARTASSPQALLPAARTVICIAVPYATDAPARPPLTGRVSNYAWSTDYHRRMRALLSELARSVPGDVAIVCDTAPLAERAFAARAGLGWIGKHTNLIHPELGSFIFLGEILTSVDFGEDAPLKKTCGSCVRCVQACPTGALRGDYTIDATRCIADLTQRTDSIPREMRAQIGDWVWGCDICQLVCPPTMQARPHADRANDAVPELAAPSLQKLLRLRSSEFKRLYRNSAVGWRGAAVLRRNAAVALGNALDRSAVPALSDALSHDPHPMVREHVAWALGRIASPAALAALRTRLEREENHAVRLEIDSSLEPFGTAGRFNS